LQVVLLALITTAESACLRHGERLTEDGGSTEY